VPDFMLEPDEIEPERPNRRRPVRVVSTGLAPTAEVPASARRGREQPPCYASCEACGTMVLTGVTATGTRLAVEPQRLTYAVNWPSGTPEPTLYESRGYPLYRCHWEHRETPGPMP
jgi:hypothetical protein